MKVLRVINSLGIGGAERSIVTNVPIHNKRGVQTDVLLLNGRSSFFIDSLKNQGINVFYFTNNQNIKTIYNPFLFIRMIKYFKNYDIVHAHLFPSIYWVALAKLFSISKTRIVLTEHSTENRRREGNCFYKMVERWIYGRFDALITITPEAKINLNNHLKGKYEINMIYNGVDLKAFQNVEKPYKFPNTNVEKPFYLLQVASFRVQKDQKTLIRALEHLPENILVVFVGDGPAQEECIELAKELNVFHRTVFLGLQEQIPELMCAADLVIMSSIYEGFGRAAVEGMAASKPVIASNVKGLAQVVNEERLLFEVGNEIELAQIVTDLYENESLYHELSDICFENAQRFSLEKMIEQYENVYRRVLSKE